MKWFLHAKIHKATVTEADLNYIGSITIDEELMDKVGLMAGEKVLIVDNTNGARLETYVIAGKRNSGTICMNGGAAHSIKKGDEIIIMGFELSKKTIEQKCILVDKKNKFLKFLKMDSLQNEIIKDQEQIKIEPAKTKNIDGILSVQQENLVLSDKQMKDPKMAKQGFLVHALKSNELKDIIQDTKNHILLIAKKENEIYGYMLSYNLKKWKKLKPNWIKDIIIPKETKQIIDDKKVLYLRHIARKKNAKGCGNRLLTSTIETAKSQKYDYIICEILEKPTENTLSKKFHEQFEFKKIGKINEENLIWGLYLKKL